MSRNALTTPTRHVMQCLNNSNTSQLTSGCSNQCNKHAPDHPGAVPILVEVAAIVVAPQAHSVLPPPSPLLGQKQSERGVAHCAAGAAPLLLVCLSFHLCACQGKLDITAHHCTSLHIHAYHCLFSSFTCVPVRGSSKSIGRHMDI